MGETYKHFPYSDEAAKMLAASMEGKLPATLPPVAALTPDYVVSKIDGTDGKYDFDLHKLAGGDTVHITRWQKDPMSEDDVSQSIQLSEMLDKIMERRMQSSTPMTATMMCAEYRDGIMEYREACRKISEYLVDDLKKGEIGLYSQAIINLFGHTGYTFFRDLACSHHPELHDIMLKNMANYFKGITTTKEDDDNGERKHDSD